MGKKSGQSISSSAGMGRSIRGEADVKWFNIALILPFIIPIGVVLLAIYFVGLLNTLILVFGGIIAAYILAAIFIYSGICMFWISRGIRIMYIYSDSPLWKDHIKKEILPKLPPNSIIMNWSERKTWKKLSLSSIVFHYFGGRKAFNPMAILFNPFRRAKVYRFYGAFKEYKHGKPERLELMERDFLQKLVKR
jgi:hypothetical protein